MHLMICIYLDVFKQKNLRGLDLDSGTEQGWYGWSQRILAALGFCEIEQAPPLLSATQCLVFLP